MPRKTVRTEAHRVISGGCSCGFRVGEGMGMGRRSGESVSRFGNFRVRPWLSIAGSICLVQMLSGCILGSEKPELAVDIPPAYRNAGSKPYAALPTYEWWKRFRSRELTGLVEEAQQANLDIAAAVARIL